MPLLSLPVPRVHNRSIRPMALVPLTLCLLNVACGGGELDATAAAPADSVDDSQSVVVAGSTTRTPRVGTSASGKGKAGSTTGGTTTGTVAPPSATDYVPAGYSLSFADEFSGSALDRTKWCTRYVYGGGPALQVPDKDCTPGGRGTLDFFNDEQQRYVDVNTAGKTMHEVSGGILKLNATKTRRDTYASYESAMIRSKAVFRPTSTESLYITARLRMPDVRGSWPAFWLAPTLTPEGAAVWPPEIDMLEGALNEVEDTNNMYHSTAVQQNIGGSGSGGATTLTYHSAEFDSKYRNYIGAGSIRGTWIEIGLEWQFTSFCTYFNGQKMSCEDYEWKDNAGQPAPPAPILLNLAIGGQWAARHGIDTTKFPTSFDIDRVRVYRKTLAP